MEPEATSEAIVSPSPLAWSPPLQEQRRVPWRRLWWVPVALVVVVAVALMFVQIPYYSLSPGEARAVDDLISTGKNVKTFPPKGDVLLTTVSLRHVTVYEALWGWVDGDTDVYAEHELFPKGTDPTAFNAQLMADSQQIGVIVALRQLGYRVKEHGNGAYVLDVQQGLPAFGVLTTDDVIVGIDGKQVTTSERAVDLISKHKPGDLVRIRAWNIRTDQFRTVRVTLGNRGNGKAILGVQLQTRAPRFDFPFNVKIESGGIGGPSAGLAFALAVMDRLTPGELTGGRKIAVTGELRLDGTVGPIGGIAQKTAAVRAAGIEVFLVPADDFELAKRTAGDDLRIIKVAKLSDALKALRKLGGDPVKKTSRA